MFVILSIVFMLSLIFLFILYPYYKFSFYTPRKIVYAIAVVIYSGIVFRFYDEYSETALYLILAYTILAIISQIYHKILHHESGRNKS